MKLSRKKKASGDSWQVIYMDLMTIIMVFFVILWSINQGKDEGISDTVGDVTTRVINLPGDVLFAAGKSSLGEEGKHVISKLFNDPAGDVLNFDSNGLVKRMLFVHGHTDSEGEKEKNIRLAFDRALAAYQEIKRYGNDVSDHVVICSHADNSPVVDVPNFQGKLTPSQKQSVREAHKTNRRITIEDKLVNQFKAEE